MADRTTTGRPEAPEASRGIIGAARRVFAHASAIARLERELATSELQRKVGTLGAGVGVAVAAAVLAVFAVGFGLATLAAALALLVDWWLALLIVFLVLLLLVAALLLVARALLRAGTPLKPEQALEEARLTTERMRNARGD